MIAEETLEVGLVIDLGQYQGEEADPSQRTGGEVGRETGDENGASAQTKESCQIVIDLR